MGLRYARARKRVDAVALRWAAAIVDRRMYPRSLAADLRKIAGYLGA